MDDLARIKQVLEEDPSLRWGFVIYRCTYGNDKAWDRFMKRLNKRTRLNLEEEGAGHLFERIDWCVQDDVRLSKASASDVRRRFRRWIKEGGEKDYWNGTARFMACVMVDKLDLQSVLKGPPPQELDTFGVGSVTLVSLNRKQGETLVGLSYLVPRVYSLLEDPGWENFAVEEGEVATP